LQYSFHDLNFHLRISYWYIFFSSRYLCFLLSLNYSLFLVLWFSRHNALIFFHIAVRTYVHKGPDFLCFVLLRVLIILKASLHTVGIASVNELSYTSKLFSFATFVDKFISNSFTRLCKLYFCKYLLYLVLIFGRNFNICPLLLHILYPNSLQLLLWLLGFPILYLRKFSENSLLY